MSLKAYLPTWPQVSREVLASLAAVVVVAWAIRHSSTLQRWTGREGSQSQP